MTGFTNLERDLAQSMYRAETGQKGTWLNSRNEWYQKARNVLDIMFRNRSVNPFTSGAHTPSVETLTAPVPYFAPEIGETFDSTMSRLIDHYNKYIVGSPPCSGDAHPHVVETLTDDLDRIRIDTLIRDVLDCGVTSIEILNDVVEKQNGFMTEYELTGKQAITIEVEGGEQLTITKIKDD